MLTVWVEAMDSVLHRRTISSTADSVAQALKLEILEQIQTSKLYSSSPFRVPSVGITQELQSDEISIQRLATFGRILIEQIVRELVISQRLSWNGNLFEGITELGRHGKIAPWIISHFHTLRVLVRYNSWLASADIGTKGLVFLIEFVVHTYIFRIRQVLCADRRRHHGLSVGDSWVFASSHSSHDSGA